jgi:uncharacterized membrane protein (DUF4010 family)
MTGFLTEQSTAFGFVVAMAIGFLIGRTRERGIAGDPRAGIRDFVITALLGALGARIGEPVLTVALAAAVAAILVVVRLQHPERVGITTDLALLATFALGFLCLTPGRPLAAALGIVVAVVLLNKDRMHRFALQTISEKEFGDTLKFLGLIFIVLPLLPEGGFGPFGFFEPRKVWFFVILVSAVSFVGYFLTKFFDPSRGVLLSALVGGLASTTAYTGGVSKVVAEAPQSAVPMARAALLANTILFPRMLLILTVANPVLAAAAAPVLAGMMAAGLLGVWVVGRTGAADDIREATAGFTNPFALGPALKFGIIFAAVLFLSHVGRFFLGNSGQFLTAGLGGLIDVDAVLLSVAGFHGLGETTARDAVLSMVLAVAANAAFKSVLATASRQPSFYLRLIGGFVAMVVTGAMLALTIDVAGVARLLIVTME